MPSQPLQLYQGDQLPKLLSNFESGRETSAYLFTAGVNLMKSDAYFTFWPKPFHSVAASITGLSEVEVRSVESSFRTVFSIALFMVLLFLPHGMHLYYCLDMSFLWYSWASCHIFPTVYLIGLTCLSCGIVEYLATSSQWCIWLHCLVCQTVFSIIFICLPDYIVITILTSPSRGTVNWVMCPLDPVCMVTENLSWKFTDISFYYIHKKKQNHKL